MNKGTHHSEETKRKMALAKLGTHRSEETKKKISEGLSGSKSYRWKGGKSRHSAGYVTVTIPGRQKKQELEHRVIMEKKLGRPLKPDEVVHHEDEVKDNNDPKNLGLFSGQGDHSRHHITKRDVGNIPDGICHCGCGEKTKIASKTSMRDGWIKGQPLKFVNHHNLKDNLNWPEKIQEFPK